MDNNSVSVTPTSSVLNPQPLDWSWTWQLCLHAFILSLIILSSILSNLFVIYAFISLPRKSPSNIVIFNLALADFLVSLLVLPPLAIYQVTRNWYFGPCSCTLWICTHFALCAASILSTLFICIERFIGVSFPLEHTRILTTKRIYKTIVILWIIALIPSLIRVFILHEPLEDPEHLVCKTTHRLANAIISSVIVLYIPALGMIILYSRIFCIASQRLKNIEKGFLQDSNGFKCKVWFSSAPPSHTSFSSHFYVSKKTSNGSVESFVSIKSSTSISAKNNNNHEDSQTGNGRQLLTKKSVSFEGATNCPPGNPNSQILKQIRLAKKLFVLVGAVLISYVPYFTALLLMAIDPSWVRDDVFRSLTWLRYFNSSVNPFIYAFAMPAFRIPFVTAISRKRSNSNTTKNNSTK